MGRVVDEIKRRQHKGFTIVELLIVISVIGVLAAITIVGYGAIVNNASDTALKDDLSKLGDVLKLATLDQQTVPSGGATSASTGDSTVLTGIQFKPAVGVYDQNVANVYYCSGLLNGVLEFTAVARSKSGNAFSYSSKGGIANFSGYTWTTANNGIAVCGLAGYAAPFTWSYGYNPAVNYGWFAWAYSGEIITNIVLNPKGLGSTTGWFSPIVSSVSTTTNVTWNGKTDWYRYTWDGTGASTVRLNVNQSDLVGGQTYTASMLVGNSGASTVAWTNDFCDQNVTNFTLAAGQQTRVYFSASRSTYDSIYRFLDFNLSTSGATSLLVSDVMITAGTNQYQYGDGNTNIWVWNGGAYASTSKGPGK